MTVTVDARKTLTPGQLWHAVVAFPRWLAAPTVLAEWTVEPRWHLALKHLRMLLVLAVYSLAWYWLGGYATATAPTGYVPAGLVPAALVAPEAASAAAPPPESLQAEDAAGLRIDSFRISAVSGYPNRLRYEMGLTNKGRKLVGKLHFVVLGEQNGEVREMPLDPALALSDAKPRIEVSRLLNTRGYLDLPEGYVVHKVVVQVLEGASPRVARSAPMWPT